MADATTQASTLQILLDIRARLDELTKAREGIQKVREEAVSTSAMLKQGFGIDFAHRAIDLFKEAVLGAVGASSQLASEVQRGSRQVEISAEAYQVLAKKGSMAFDDLLVRMQRYRANLGQALMDPVKGNVFTALGLNAQGLSTMPLERQMELVARALSQVSDANVRARLMQELFGRDAVGMVPLLQRLRTEGYDKLRDSAREAGTVLDDSIGAALKKTSKDAEEAKTKLAVALAPINLQMQQAKATMISFFANNAGPISSGLEAAAAAGLVTGIYKGMLKLSADGALQAQFANFGKAMAGPFGVAFAAAVGAFIIQEIERRAIEANARVVQFGNERTRAVHQIIEDLKKLDSDDGRRDLYNRAVTMQQRAMIERKQLYLSGDSSQENKDRIQIVEQEIEQLNRLIPLINERAKGYIEQNTAGKQNFDRILQAQTDLFVVETNHKLVEDSSWTTQRERREVEEKYLRSKIILLEEILDLTKKLPQRDDEQPEERNLQIQKLQAQIEAAKVARSNLVPGVGQSDASRIHDSYTGFRFGFSGFNATSGGSRMLSPMEGVTAGFQQWSMSLGSIGQQISGTIGGALSNVSQGLVGLITKTQTWGQVGRSVGMLFLQTLVQIGMQELVIHGLQAMGVALHVGGEATKTAATVAGTSARSAANVAEAGTVSLTAGIASIFKSIMELGPIAGPLVFVAAVAGLFALVRAMSKGFATGGYTGDGGKYEPAGVAHKGEVIFSQDDVARNGGVAAVEAMRFGQQLPGLGTNGARGSGSSSSIPTISGRPTLHVVYTDDAQLVARLRRRPDFEVAVTDIGKRRRGEIFSV